MAEKTMKTNPYYQPSKMAMKRHLIYFSGNTTPCYVHTETNS